MAPGPFLLASQKQPASKGIIDNLLAASIKEVVTTMMENELIKHVLSQWVRTGRRG